jgi:hypothetical protein
MGRRRRRKIMSRRRRRRASLHPSNRDGVANGEFRRGEAGLGEASFRTKDLM